MDDTKTEGVGVPVSGDELNLSAQPSNSPEDKVEALRRVRRVC